MTGRMYSVVSQRGAVGDVYETESVIQTSEARLRLLP
jgi:hypothetical protein